MKTNLRFLSVLLAVCFLVSCGSAEQGGETEYDATGRYVLNENGEAVMAEPGLEAVAVSDNARVFYEIFVGSFSDSDGDGIGDLRGIINRMDYLNDGDPDSGLSLGVEGLWLTPIFLSPSYHKYDVADFYAVDPQFGTMDDLRELLELCHERDVKVILDLPINHTSLQNEWFKAFHQARKNEDPGDEYYYFYSCCSKNAPAPAGRTFVSLVGTDIRYECNFSTDMPEINFDNYQVRLELLKVARYYLDMGVDGFRFDAAKYIFFGDNAKSISFWEWYIARLREAKPDIYTVAEVWDGAGTVDQYTLASNCFDFTCSQSDGMIARTARRGDVNAYTAYVADAVARLRGRNPDGMMIPFITNHDMDRAAGFLSPTGGDMHMAANLYILSSGSPFIYYGEELGLRGSRGGANTDANRRLHMLWGDGDTVTDPEGSTYNKQAETSVKEQRADADSLYSYYKQLIMIRRANPEIARGEYTPLRLTGTKAGGFIARWNGSGVCVLHNTTSESVMIDLRAAGAGEYETINAWIGAGQAVLDGDILTLDAQTSVALRKK